MKKILIQEKLSSLNTSIEDISLGDFDFIGEYTAKKSRSQDSDLYKSSGCFFKPNYERGILMYYLVKEHNINSVLEIGFGRGYSTFCMAKAMTDFNIDGKITTVDPFFNKELIYNLSNIFPKEWFNKIEFVNSTSDNFFQNNSNKNYDFIYIDGDHTYNAVKKDWENTKNIFNKFLLFDDYNLAEKDKNIQCAKVIDDISDFNKELIIMDRRIFLDDRKYLNDQINYGQVLVTKK